MSWTTAHRQSLKEFRYIFISFITLVCWWVAIVYLLPKSAPILGIYIFFVIVFYATVIVAVANNLASFTEKKLPLSVFLFVVFTFFVVGLFAEAWRIFTECRFTECVLHIKDSNFLSNVDAFYFSTVCFTTLGFGDLVPSNDAAKILVCIEAIFGVSHMVIFFSTITLVGISARYVESDDGL